MRLHDDTSSGPFLHEAGRGISKEEFVISRMLDGAAHRVVCSASSASEHAPLSCQ